LCEHSTNDVPIQSCDNSDITIDELKTNFDMYNVMTQECTSEK